MVDEKRIDHCDLEGILCAKTSYFAKKLIKYIHGKEVPEPYLVARIKKTHTDYCTFRKSIGRQLYCINQQRIEEYMCDINYKMIR